MKKHLKEECPKTIHYCKYSHVGCKIKVLKNSPLTLYYPLLYLYFRQTCKKLFIRGNRIFISKYVYKRLY